MSTAMERAAHVRARIFDAIEANGHGLTFAAVAAVTGLCENTVRGRLSELEAEGIIRRKGRRRVRGHRRALAVYVVVPAQRALPLEPLEPLEPAPVDLEPLAEGFATVGAVVAGVADGLARAFGGRS